MHCGDVEASTCWVLMHLVQTFQKGFETDAEQEVEEEDKWQNFQNFTGSMCWLLAGPTSPVRNAQ